MDIYKYVYTHRVDVCVCVHFRLHTPSSHVGMYVFPYMDTDFMLVFVYLEFTCGCVYISVYIHRVPMWVCVYFRIFAQSSCLCLYIYIHTHGVSMCVCLYTCICTRRLHFGVYIFTNMYTEFGRVCM